ncbi:putative Vacuolar basic amino acid transporter 5 (putative) [Rhodotorula toruloides]|uniref:BY PROTMAP: gi/647395034/emb/CDR36270.1/ RHTO0S01e17964g1_1 [Rhodosporidium toruloides] n=1 Tax=Rhodotorula toruloides TaxID=5286 RepID=A0A0K3C8K4_RHOTO|nr:putative Vacuolar basic amino acid transporter 5 (putative) [Rhodotorula toruloides]PRQ78209.1 iron permease [Rhodotorula toruloides]
MTSAPLASPTPSSTMEKDHPLPSPPAEPSRAASTLVESIDSVPKSAKKPLSFWLIFVALCFSMFLSALDVTAVSTVLPDMANEFKSADYAWIGSAYALTSTALIPWTGGLANIFGRRPVLVGALLFFALGSALTGAAQSMAMAIAGRSIQGIGGGAILTMAEIIVIDLVPLAERGSYMGILGAVWAIASVAGPPIGGGLATAGAWRWLFYLNLPLTGLALGLVLVFLNIKAPQTTLKEKLEQMDYANVIFVAGATSLILGLTWGGSAYAWSSYHVLAPLILGIFGLVLFFVVEARFVKYPTVPFDILGHPTALVGYVTTFLHSIAVLAVIYFLPTAYFQASKSVSPIRAGIDLFPICFTIAPFAIFTGASVTVIGKYKAQNVLAWAFMVVGFGLMTLLKWDSKTGMWAGFPIFFGIGAGGLYAGLNFPVLAPIAVSQQPLAMAFFGFIRSLGQVFGIAIGSTILQNRLAQTLPQEFLERVGGRGDEAFAAIPGIKDLPEPLRTAVKTSFARSTRTIWFFCLGITAAGLLISLLMKDIPLATTTDEERWGLKEREGEKGGEGRAEEGKVDV